MQQQLLPTAGTQFFASPLFLNALNDFKPKQEVYSTTVVEVAITAAAALLR